MPVAPVTKASGAVSAMGSLPKRSPFYAEAPAGQRNWAAGPQGGRAAIARLTLRRGPPILGFVAGGAGGRDPGTPDKETDNGRRAGPSPSSSPSPADPAPAVADSGLPPDLQTAGASKDDRSMAMIAHILGLAGFLGPLILYLVKKDGASRFLKFHMLQSLWYQVAVVVAYFALVDSDGHYLGRHRGHRSCICMPIILLLWVGDVIYFIYGAVQVNGGKDFEYWQVGPWVRKSL